MMTSAKRPRPVRVADIRARAVRGPDDSGRWYWRWLRAGETDAGGGVLGWFTRDEASRELIPLVDGTGRCVRPDIRTVRELMSKWMAAVLARSDLAEATKAQRMHVAATVADRIGDILLSRVTRATMEAYRDRRLREHPFARTTVAGKQIERELTSRTIAPRTVRLELETFRAAWRWAIEVGGIPFAREVPTATVQVRGWVRNHFTPSRPQVVAVLAQLEGRVRIAALLYASTGCRKSEVAGLRWAQVDLAGGRITVVGKTGRRVVPISDDLVDTLRTWRAEHLDEDHVLPGTALSRRQLDPVIHTACRRAKVPEFPVGGFRRFVVREVYRSGEDPGVAAALVGHSPAVALKHYSQISDEEKAEAVRKARLGSFREEEKVVSIGRRRGSR